MKDKIILILGNLISLKKVRLEYYYFVICFVALIALIVYLLLMYEKSMENKKGLEEFADKASTIQTLFNRINNFKIFELLSKYKFYKELKKKTKVVNPKLEDISLELDSLIFIGGLSGFIFALFFFLLFNWSLFFVISVFLPLGIYLAIFLIEEEYNKKQKNFENRISEIGLIVKQITSLNRNIVIVLKNLSEVNDPVIKEEFKDVYNEFLNSNSVRQGLEKINERFPNSLYLKTIKELLLIYSEHQKDISNEIDTLVQEIESFGRIRKKIEVEFAKQDKTVMLLLMFSFGAVLMFVFTNEIFRKFYMSRLGMSIGAGVSLYVMGGIFVIYLLKIEIVKERKAKKKKE